MSKAHIFAHTIVDLTHPLTATIPTWNNSCGFHLTTLLDYDQCTTGTTFRVQKITLNAGSGTHIDAPAHCIPNGATIASLPLERLITPCVMIDLSYKAHATYQIVPDDIIEFESRHGTIPPKSCVIFSTGWSQHWNEPSHYRNNLQFPTLHADTARLLVTRNIYGIGIDTLSPDMPGDTYPVHEILLGADIYIIENVAHAEKLPATGTQLIALPLPLMDGTEAPIRLIALTY